MAWVVDTSVLLDIRLPDPVFGMASAKCLARHFAEGLVICPVSYVEIAPAFGGNHNLQQDFLRELGIGWREPWNWRDTEAAHQQWTKHVAQRHLGKAAKRLMADALIEAFASRFQGLITRNPRHFTTVPIVVPS